MQLKEIPISETENLYTLIYKKELKENLEKFISFIKYKYKNENINNVLEEYIKFLVFSIESNRQLLSLKSMNEEFDSVITLKRELEEKIDIAVENTKVLKTYIREN